MDQLQCIRSFIAVVDAGGFAGAARALKLSPASVTRAVAELEAQLGVSLLTRTTRVTRVTDAGAQYYEASRRILAELDEANLAAAGAHAKPRGRLVLTASAMFGNRYVAPIVVEFLRSYPEVQAVCHFVDRVVNVDEEGIDVAVRIGELPDSSLQAMRVGRVRRIACAAPSYLDANGAPTHPRDLVQHTVVSSTGISPSPHWRFWERGLLGTWEVRPVLVTDTNESVIAAAVAGLGIARLLSYQVADELKRGQLKTVLTDFEPQPLPVHVLHRQGRRPDAKVRLLLDMLVERLQSDASLN